jgi:uncharacterized membrane protein YfcA
LDASLALAILLMAFACEYVDSSLGMGYGTILSPLLIIMGMDPLQVVPSILLSQAVAGLTAAVFHQRFKNMDVLGNGRDLRIALLLTGVGLVGVVVGVGVALSLPTWALKAYIGILVIVMGAIILSRKVFNFSWNRLVGTAALSGFNKAMSGGGFGPVVTCGQVISGVEVRRSIGITTLVEGPICIASFILYVMCGVAMDPWLPVVLTVGAVTASPLGPMGTRRWDTKAILVIVGLLTVGLGAYTLVKTFLA